MGEHCALAETARAAAVEAGARIGIQEPICVIAGAQSEPM